MKHIIGANLTSTVPQSQTLTVDEDSAGQRLDNFLMRQLKGVPKTHVYRIIRSGEVRINKGRVAADTRIAAGDLVRLPPVRASERAEEKAQAMAALSAKAAKAASSGQGGSAATSAGGFAPAKDFPILFEDDSFLAINKPAGVAVHGGSGVSFGVIEQLRQARPTAKFLELVHRLDRETSGILLLAKKRSALVELHRQIREGQTDKRYYLLAHGEIVQGAQVMQLKYPLHKYLLANGERRVRVDPEGLPSHTALRVTKILKREDAAITLAEAQLKTGRTHQIRVHLESLGFPILGDPVYRKKAPGPAKTLPFTRQALHAYALTLEHPAKNELMTWFALPPIDLMELMLHIGINAQDLPKQEALLASIQNERR